MKVTKVIYLRRVEQQLTEKEVLDCLYIGDQLTEDFTPDNWTALKTIELDIPDSLINDIISANTEIDVDKQVAELEAKLSKLLKLRKKGNKNA